MKLALIADVHGNAPALDAVLKAAAASGAEALCVAGDVVGYYYEPARCLEMLATWPADFVRGNHEDLLAGSANDPAVAADVHRRYGSGLAVAHQTLSADQTAAIAAWPRTRLLTFDALRILLCHGAPWDTDTYLYPDSDPLLWERCADAGVDIIVAGHTHYPVDRHVGSTRVINPGSAGQPRDRRPGAAWALLDTAAGTCAWRRETYDMWGVIAEARARDPHLPYLQDVLTRTAVAEPAP